MIPDYILAIPKDDQVPEIVASGNSEDLDDLKYLKEKGMYLYRRVGGIK